MRFDTSQAMRLGQHMKLAPHMIQSMEILQMSTAELEERIEQELESNATLEIAEPGGEAPELDGQFTNAAEMDNGRGIDDRAPMTVGAEGGNDDFERLDSFERDNPEAFENEYEAGDSPVRQQEERYDERRSESYEQTGGSSDGKDAKSEAMANTAAREATPTEQLSEQWAFADVPDEYRALGELIISHIEPDGYVRTPLEVIASRAVPAAGYAGPAPTVAQLEEALKVVQATLEPTGVAARSTKECLLLQIGARRGEQAALAYSGKPLPKRAAGEPEPEAINWDLVLTLVEDHLTDLGQNRLPKVAARCGVDVDAVKRAMAVLRTLSLAPGRQLIRTSEPGIVPDAFVEFDADADRYVAYLNDRSLPTLRLNQEYAKLASDRGTDKPTKAFLRTNITNAQFLMEAIEQRKKTLLRVVQAVVAAQREYFESGPQALRPLPMTKVAEQLGVHVATVSRAVAEKYLGTPRGVVALRKFFSGGTTDAEGQEVSWDAIKAALLDIVSSEDKASPLSDDDLAAELKNRGLEIARRTVAKYRGQLDIPTGRLRKTHT